MTKLDSSCGSTLLRFFIAYYQLSAFSLISNALWFAAMGGPPRAPNSAPPQPPQPPQQQPPQQPLYSQVQQREQPDPRYMQQQQQQQMNSQYQQPGMWNGQQNGQGKTTARSWWGHKGGPNIGVCGDNHKGLTVVNFPWSGLVYSPDSLSAGMSKCPSEWIGRCLRYYVPSGGNFQIKLKHGSVI